jgi:hypothetical protein
MRCTECGKLVAPVVAIDIDGTLGDYHRHFLRFAESYLGQAMLWNYDGGESFKGWFKRETGASDDDWHDLKLAYRQGGMKRSMPVYDDAAYLCQSAQLEGAEVWVTTTRPYIRHDNIDPDTREWLRRNNIVYDFLIYDGAKYEKLAELVGIERVCAVVDDLPEEITEAQRLFGNEVPILRRNSFNGAITWLSAAHDLRNIAELVIQRIREWRYVHESINAGIGRQVEAHSRVHHPDRG